MEAGHIVKSYDEELRHLDSLIAEMGGMAEDQLRNAIAALVNRDKDLALHVIAEDKKLDALESEADAFTMQILARRQPMAEDLRAVIVALKMSANLERIGDYSKNIAKRAMTLSTEAPPGGTAATLGRMAALVQGMIKSVIDAYVTRDIDLADDVRARDAEVDLLHTSLFRELLTHMMEDPRQITCATHFLFIAKNIERIGDHATNVAEYIHFLVTGKIPEDEREKKDATSETVVGTDL